MERKIPVVGRQDQIEHVTQILGGKRRITAVDILFWHYVNMYSDPYTQTFQIAGRAAFLLVFSV
jgi:hypothetical protein